MLLDGERVPLTSVLRKLKKSAFDSISVKKPNSEGKKVSSLMQGVPGQSSICWVSVI